MSDKGAATTAANLRKAADHVERVGLNRGGLYFHKSIEGQPTVPLAERPCCALGAIAEAIDPEKARVLLPESDPERGQVQDWWTDGTFTSYVHGSPEAKALEIELNKTKTGQLWITAWNDYYAADATEVATTMRAAADRLEVQA